MSEKKEMDVVRKQNEPSEAAKKAAMEISNVFCAKQGELKTVQEIIQSAIDAAARVEPAEKELIEARSWALDILDLTDAHLKKIDPDYEKLDWRTDSFCKSHARKLLEGATSTPQVQASEQTSLLPCPFCGDSRASTVWESCEPISEGDTNRLWFIECERCGAQGPVQNRENECVNSWNTRANASLGAAQQVSGKADNTDAVHSKLREETDKAIAFKGWSKFFLRKREELQLSQTEMSSLLGCGLKSYCRWENGSQPTETVIRALLRLLAIRQILNESFQGHNAGCLHCAEINEIADHAWALDYTWRVSLISSPSQTPAATTRKQESGGVAEETKTDEAVCEELFQNILCELPNVWSIDDERLLQIKSLILAALRQKPAAKETDT